MSSYVSPCFFFCVFFVGQAHAKRVAAENKRTRRFALGGGFGSGRSRAARPKMGNSRGMVVKAFAADSDEEEESEEVSWGKMTMITFYMEKGIEN